MERPSLAAFDCSVAQSLEVIGEWWSLMIIREVFMGRRRFEEMRDDLGIARNTLTNRLNRLVDEGVLERRTYSTSSGRAEYHLTAAGRDLQPVLLALLAWGNKWRPLPGGPPTALIHSCGKATTPRLVCDQCDQPITSRNVRMEPTPSRRNDDTNPLVRAAAARSARSEVS